MSGITVSGLSSNLPIDTWIEKLVAVKQAKIDTLTADKTALTTSSSALSTIKTNYSSLLSSLQTITDSRFGASADLFAQKTVTSSNSSTVTATVSALAAKQNLKVSVSQLATSTVAQSGTSVSAVMQGSTKVSALAKGSVTDGSFSLYVDNKKYSVSVASTDTINDVASRINGLGVEGLNASVADGKLTIKDTDGSSTIAVGSNSDTSNFATVVGLVKQQDGSFSSNSQVLLANSRAALTGDSAGYASTIKAGTFTIGNATFTIDSTMTMDQLVTDINTNSDSGVTAYWDNGAGKLVLNASTQGAANINIQAGTSNFTDVMGLTTSTWNPDGSMKTTALADGTQELGKYAKLSINGTEIISSSNTVTSDISGLTGVTLTLTGESTTENPTTTVSITNDNTKLKNALSSFVSAFNTVIANSEEATSSDGYLKGDNLLVMIKDRLRTMATSSVDGTEGGYNNLASIGITTGEVGTAVDAATNQLVIDEDVLANALATNPDAVKKLLIGEGDNKGVMGELGEVVDDTLDPLDGYFVTRGNTYTEQIKDLTTTIDKKNTELEEYKTSLQAKFSAMEKVIATLNSQLDSINAMIKQTSSNKD